MMRFWVNTQKDYGREMIMADKNEIEEEYEEEIECDDDDQLHDLQEENERFQNILHKFVKETFTVNFKINKENQVRLDPEHYIAIETTDVKSELAKLDRKLIGKYSIRHILQLFAELDLFKEYSNPESVISIQFTIAKDNTPLLIIEKGKNRGYISPGIEVDE